MRDKFLTDDKQYFNIESKQKRIQPQLPPSNQMTSKIAYNGITTIEPDCTLFTINYGSNQSTNQQQKPQVNSIQRIAPNAKNKEKRIVSKERMENKPEIFDNSKASSLYQTIQQGTKKIQKRFQTPQKLQVPRNYIQQLLNKQQQQVILNQGNIGTSEDRRNSSLHHNMTMNPHQDMDSNLSFYQNLNNTHNQTLTKSPQQIKGDTALLNNFIPSTNNYINTQPILPTQIQGNSSIYNQHQPNQINNYNNINVFAYCELKPRGALQTALTKVPSSNTESGYVFNEYNTTPLLQTNITRNISNFKAQTNFNANNANTYQSSRSNSVQKRATSTLRSSRPNKKQFIKAYQNSNLSINKQKNRDITPNPAKMGNRELTLVPLIQQQQIHQNQQQYSTQRKIQEIKPQLKQRVTGLGGIQILGGGHLSSNQIRNIHITDLIEPQKPKIQQQKTIYEDKQQTNQKSNRIFNIFKKDIPIIVDDRSSYYDSDRESVFYKNKQPGSNKHQYNSSKDKDCEDENEIDQQNILWHQLCDDNVQPTLIESRLDMLVGEDQGSDTFQSSDGFNDLVGQAPQQQLQPRTYKNSQYNMKIAEDGDDYSFEKKLRQDTLTAVGGFQSNQTHYKKTSIEKENKKIKLGHLKAQQQQQENRSLKQSNQAYLLQLVSNQDLDNMKQLIHKSIQQRTKGTFTPSQQNPSENLYSEVKMNMMAVGGGNVGVNYEGLRANGVIPIHSPSQKFLQDESNNSEQDIERKIELLRIQKQIENQYKKLSVDFDSNPQKKKIGVSALLHSKTQQNPNYDQQNKLQVNIAHLPSQFSNIQFKLNQQFKQGANTLQIIKSIPQYNQKENTNVHSHENSSTFQNKDKYQTPLIQQIGKHTHQANAEKIQNQSENILPQQGVKIVSKGVYQQTSSFGQSKYSNGSDSNVSKRLSLAEYRALREREGGLVPQNLVSHQNNSNMDTEGSFYRQGNKIDNQLTEIQQLTQENSEDYSAIDIISQPPLSSNHRQNQIPQSAGAQSIKSQQVEKNQQLLGQTGGNSKFYYSNVFRKQNIQPMSKRSETEDRIHKISSMNSINLLVNQMPPQSQPVNHQSPVLYSQHYQATSYLPQRKSQLNQQSPVLTHYSAQFSSMLNRGNSLQTNDQDKLNQLLYQGYGDSKSGSLQQFKRQRNGGNPLILSAANNLSSKKVSTQRIRK